MDINVSKNTFIYKFLKLRLNQRNLTISVKESLKQHLLSTIDSHRQFVKINLDLEFVATTLDSKLVLSRYSSPTRLTQDTSNPKLTNILYRCAIAFPLEKYYRLPPKNIAEKLWEFDSFSTQNSVSEPYLPVAVRVFGAGWLDFYLSEHSLITWLEQSLILGKNQALNLDNLQPANRYPNLFLLQYVHGRCCSLLRLAERERLIKLSDRHFSSLTWQIAQPQVISWFDGEGKFYLTETAELDLLFQLLIISDWLANYSADWVKLGTKQNVEFLGE